VAQLRRIEPPLPDKILAFPFTKETKGCSDDIAPPSPTLTHANGHELRTGAEHHEMVGDLLAATLAELRLGQIDDLQVAQVRQSVDLEVLQGIHRGIQLPEL